MLGECNHMAKDKMNHRRKCKVDKQYVPLDISQFDDIIKKPKPKYDKSKPYKGKKKQGKKDYRDGNKNKPSENKQGNKQGYKKNKPNNNKPKQS